MTWPASDRRPLSGARRWLVRGVLVALVVCGAHFGGNARTQQAKPAPVAEVSAGMSGHSAIGGTEVNRW